MFTPWNAEHIPLGRSLFNWDLTPLLLQGKDRVVGRHLLVIFEQETS